MSPCNKSAFSLRWSLAVGGTFLGHSPGQFPGASLGIAPLSSGAVRGSWTFSSPK